MINVKNAPEMDHYRKHIPGFQLKRVLVYILLSVIALLSALLIDELFEQFFSPERSSNRLNRKIQENEARITSLVDKLGKARNKDANPWQWLRELNSSSPEGSSFYLYHNDSLSFWSVNTVPVPGHFDPLIFERRAGIIGNGYFTSMNFNTGQAERLVVLSLVMNNFPYENEYLKNEFNPKFRVKGNYSIAAEEIPGRQVYGDDGSFLFSLAGEAGEIREGPILWLLFTLFFMFFIFFSLALYHAYKALPSIRKYPVLMVLGYAVDLILVRFLVMYFKIPGFLYDSAIFSPYNYASSTVFPSFGDLIVNSFVILMISWVAFRHLRSGSRLKEKKWLWHTTLILLITLVFLMFSLVNGLFRSIVIHSNIPIDLNNLFLLNAYSLFSFLVMASLLLSFYLIALRTVILCLDAGHSTSKFILHAGGGILVFALISAFFRHQAPEMYIFPLLILISFRVIQLRKFNVTSFSTVIFLLFLSSLYSTYVIHHFVAIKEKDSRKLLAVKMSEERDIMAEYMLRDIGGSIYSDTLFMSILVEYPDNENSEQLALSYLSGRYFTGYLDAYDQKVTLCRDPSVLEIQPSGFVINCNEYFGNMIRDLGTPVDEDRMYYMDYGVEDFSYLFRFRFEDPLHFREPLNMYLEVFPKLVPKGMGYPELLIDKSVPTPEEKGDYSWAIYRNGELIKRVGRYVYGMDPAEFGSVAGDEEFLNIGGYSHLVNHTDENTIIVVSRKKDDLLSIISPFSYFFVFFGIYISIFILFTRKHRLYAAMNLRTRLQSSMAFILLVSFLVIGISSLIYIIRLNNNKNHDNLSEKAHSVLIEIEHKLADRETISADLSPLLEQLLIKFSVVFFTDINLYDTKGSLLGSSRSRIFREGLISDKMDANAWRMMNEEHRSLFIQQESIGTYSYLSAYIPFRNNQNELVAYLNLPYFARESDLKKEISDFLVAFINIYVLLIAITIFIALVISGYITRPLQLIRDKIRRVRLGKSNEKIEWERGDEIGHLVMEYNRMVDQLAESAELLARSERELAWREMAKQVAHEIKNPLTPMKLSVQYLKKAWDEKAPDWELRLNRFAQTIIEQIDSLSKIAAEFSDFAKMPQNKNQRIDVRLVIENAISLFKDTDNVEFVFAPASVEKAEIYADDKQMLRVFNNLIKNSIQAIGSRNDGRINIGIEQKGDYYLINVADNGSGIPEDKKDLIFIPNFTTKSSGMGLGLAMVKSIIISSGGNIWYESEEGKGTVFYIKLPVFSEEEQAEGV